MFVTSELLILRIDFDICFPYGRILFWSISDNDFEWWDDHFYLWENYKHLKFALGMYATNGQITEYHAKRFQWFFFLFSRIHFKDSLGKIWLGYSYGIRKRWKMRRRKFYITHSPDSTGSQPTTITFTVTPLNHWAVRSRKQCFYFIN